MDKITIRPSGVAGFFDCQYRWFRDTIKNPIRRTSIRPIIGTAIHKGAEEHYRDSIKAGLYTKSNSAYVDKAIECFRESVNLAKEESILDLSEATKTNINNSENTICEYSKKYSDEIVDLNNAELPIEVEKKYEIDLSSKSIGVEKISGTLDIVGKNYIVDIKTANKNRDVKSYIVQQGIYALLRQANGEFVDELKIDKIIFNNKVKSVFRCSINEETMLDIESIINYSKTLLNEIISRVDKYYKTQDESLFTGNPNTFLCSAKYCPYYSQCKFHI